MYKIWFDNYAGDSIPILISDKKLIDQIVEQCRYFYGTEDGPYIEEVEYPKMLHTRYMFGRGVSKDSIITRFPDEFVSRIKDIDDVYVMYELSRVSIIEFFVDTKKNETREDLEKRCKEKAIFIRDYFLCNKDKFNPKNRWWYKGKVNYTNDCDIK